MNATNEILTGVAVLADWLGDGLSPVSQAQADQRAETCLIGNGGKECPHLRAPKWWEEHSKEPVAQAIKRQLEAKSEMKLSTALDAHPRLCDICGCCMPVKVWVPAKHIAEHTPDELLKEFPGYCFQRIEIENEGLK